MPMSADTLQNSPFGAGLEPDALELFKVAESLHRGGLAEAAAQQYSEFIERVQSHPAVFAGHWNAADCYHLLADYAQALQHFAAALALQPDHPALLAGQGSSLAGMGRMEEALQCFTRACELAPTRGQYRLLLSYALFDVGRLGEAAEQIAALRPPDAGAWVRAAVGFQSQGLSERAEACLEQARGLLGADPGDGWLNAGVLLSQHGLSEPAQEFIEQGLARNPGEQLRQTALRHLPRPPSPWDQAELQSLGPAPAGEAEEQSLDVDRWGRHLAYVVYGQDGPVAVLADGVEHGLEAEQVSYISLNEAGAWAVAALRDHKWWVLRDGQAPVGGFDECPVIQWSPQGKLAVFGPMGQADRLFLDGQHRARADRVLCLRFSSQRERLALLVIEGEAWRVYLDGQAQPAYDGISQAWLDFSPDGSRLAYIVAQPDGQCVVLDGEPGPVYDGVAGIVFSGDSQHVVYWAGRGDSCCAVLDGVETQWYEDAGDFCLDREGRRFLHHATIGGTKYVVDNGQFYGPFEDVYNLRVSPDGASAAGFVLTPEGWCCWQDGMLSPAWGDVAGGTLVWNEVRRSWVYGAWDGEWLVVDGDQPLGGYQALGHGEPALSREGLVIFAAARADQWVLVADGQESEPFDMVLTVPQVHRGVVSALVVRDGHVWRLEIEASLLAKG